MNEHSVTLPVPVDIYGLASHIAEATAQTVEAGLLRFLPVRLLDI